MTCFSKWQWPLVFRSTYNYDIEEREDIIRELKELLAQSMKNDTPKDPVTGKYISAKRGTFTTGG